MGKSFKSFEILFQEYIFWVSWNIGEPQYAKIELKNKQKAQVLSQDE